MIEMETGTWEGVTLFVIHPNDVDSIKAEYRLSDEQMHERFVVTQNVTPTTTVRMSPKVANNKALHQQALDKLRRR